MTQPTMTPVREVISFAISAMLDPREKYPWFADYIINSLRRAGYKVVAIEREEE